MIFTYVATDSVMPGHTLGESYTVDFLVQSATPKRTVMRDVVRSLSGKQETIKHHADKTWSIKFAPFTGDKIPQMEELLDSIEDGQTISVYVYGNEAEPRQMICTYDSYAFEEFMMLGDEQTDCWVTSIELRQA